LLLEKWNTGIQILKILPWEGNGIAQEEAAELTSSAIEIS